MKRLATAVWLLLASFSFAAAQSSPNLIYGQVPTPAQWNSYFAAKQDTLGYVPVNKAGDFMTGKLVTATPTTSAAGINLPAGAAPTVPLNGDMWTTTSGLFVRINGITIGPLAGGSSGSFAATLPLAVSFPAGVVTYALNVGTGLSTSGSNLILTTPVTVALGGTNCTSASGTCLDNITGFASTGFVTRTGSGTYAFQSTTNGVTFANLAQGSALSVLGVTGGSTANLASIAGTANQTLRVNGAGTALAFGSLDLSQSATVGSSLLAGTNGGTGVNNGSSTITIGGNVIHSGAFATTITVTAATNSTLPAGTHTLAALDVGQQWTASQFYGNGIFQLSGSTSGSLGLNAPAIAGSSTITFPAGTTNFSSTGGTSQFVKQASSGAAFTVVRPVCADLSDATYCATSLTNGISNANLAQMAAYTLKVNATGSTANATDTTITSLTLKASPVAGDEVMLSDSAASGAMKKTTVSALASAGSVASIDAKTGAFTTSNGITTVVNDFRLATIAGGTVLANATGSSAVPSGTISPVLGIAGSSVGTIGFNNATSGTVTISPATGALGTTTWTLRGVTDSFVGLATSDTLTNKTLTSPTVSGTLAGSITLSGNNTYGGTATFNTTIFNPGVSGGVGNQYFCFTNGTGQMTASASACGTSDSRMKNVTAQMTSKKGLDAVLAMRPVYYDWLDVASAKLGPQIGLIAQNVAEVLPELAPTGKDMTITLPGGRKVSIPNVMSIDYPKLVVPLIAAVQELNARIIALENRK